MYRSFGKYGTVLVRHLCCKLEGQLTAPSGNEHLAWEIYSLLWSDPVKAIAFRSLSNKISIRLASLRRINILNLIGHTYSRSMTPTLTNLSGFGIYQVVEANPCDPSIS